MVVVAFGGLWLYATDGFHGFPLLNTLFVVLNGHIQGRGRGPDINRPVYGDRSILGKVVVGCRHLLMDGHIDGGRFDVIGKIGKPR